MSAGRSHIFLQIQSKKSPKSLRTWSVDEALITARHDVMYYSINYTQRMVVVGLGYF